MKKKIIFSIIIIIFILFVSSLINVKAENNIENQIKIDRIVKYDGSIIIKLKSNIKLNSINKEEWTLSEDNLEFSREYDKSQKGISEIVKIKDIEGNYTEINIEIPKNIIFISDLGDDNNNGETMEQSIKTFPKAYKKLGEETGIIVLCGDITIDSNEKGNFYTTNTSGVRTKSGDIIITGTYLNSKGENIKSSINNDSSNIFEKNINLGGNTIFEKINFKSNKAYNYAICGQGNNVTFEESVTCSDSKCLLYGGFILLQDIGKEIPEVSAQDYTLTINGGTWYSASAANRRLNTPRVMGQIGNTTLIINGGEFKNSVSAGGYCEQIGDMTLKITGGKFYSNIYGLERGGVNESNTLGAKRGNVNIEITGGTFEGENISAMQDTTETPIIGNYTLKIGEKANFTNKKLSINAQNVEGESKAIVPNELLEKLDENFGKTIYVSTIGNDNNNGLTEDTPLKTIEKAFELCQNYGGTIVVLGEVEIENGNFEACKKAVNITGNWNEKDYNGVIVCKKT